MTLLAELHPYQYDAYNLFFERGNELLAFDMGTGKTVISIAICEELLDTGRVTTCLIVVPANLKLQWAKSIAKFTDCGKRKARNGDILPAFDECVIIDGTPAKKAEQYEMARQLKPGYVIIGVDQVASEYPEIASLGASMAVLDEATSIKSPASKRSRAVKKHLRYPYRLALTGTPVENKPEEVFSIMEWVDRHVLGKAYLFDKSYIIRDKFGGVKGYKNLGVLNARLSEAMCRKTWKDPDVARYLPRIDYSTWEVIPDDQTMDVYKVMARDLLDEFNKTAASSPKAKFSVSAYYAGYGGKDMGVMGKLMPVHTCMEMLLDYPGLIRDSAAKFTQDDGQGSEYAYMYYQKKQGILPRTTPKKDQVVWKTQEILWQDTGNKVLIFTRYRGMVDILVRDFKGLGWGVTEYHGEMSTGQKEASVSRFLTDKDCRLFISSHAGAYGVDMPVANYLVNYDIPWSAGTARQINGRHVRASSEHDVVHVINVITKGTLEERKADIQKFKGEISDSVLDGKARAGDMMNEVQALRLHCMEVLGLTQSSHSARL